MTNPVVPEAAIIAAKEAMREVTPPPGVSKTDWLAEHGSFALIAGAIAAAAPYILQAAKAEAWEEGCSWGSLYDHTFRSDNPYRPTQ